MCFVEPIVRLFVISICKIICYCQGNFIIRHYLFAKIFAKLFLQHNSHPESLKKIENASFTIAAQERGVCFFIDVTCA